MEKKILSVAGGGRRVAGADGPTTQQPPPTTPSGIRGQRSESARVPAALNRLLRAFGYSVLAMAALACVAEPAFSQGRRPKMPRHWPADPRRGDLPASTVGKIEDWQKVVEGRGATPEEAEQVALYRAREALSDFVSRQSYVIQHLPPDEFIVKELGELSGAQEIKSDDNPEDLGKYLVRLQLTVTDEKFRKMLEYDQQLVQEQHDQFVQSRLAFLGKLLLSIVAVLSAIVCYARLEEITKGYYTAWLRLAALGFVGAVGIGLWLFS
jgi:hypothetical protein